MCTRRIFYFFFVLILLTVSTKVDAASTSAANPPAKEPWTTQLVDWYPGSGVGTDVSIAHHPTSGMAYISYYDSINGDLWMAHEVTLVRGTAIITMIGTATWSIPAVMLAGSVQLT